MTPKTAYFQISNFGHQQGRFFDSEIFGARSEDHRIDWNRRDSGKVSEGAQSSQNRKKYLRRTIQSIQQMVEMRESFLGEEKLPPKNNPFAPSENSAEKTSSSSSEQFSPETSSKPLSISTENSQIF